MVENYCLPPIPSLRLESGMLHGACLSSLVLCKASFQECSVLPDPAGMWWMCGFSEMIIESDFVVFSDAEISKWWPKDTTQPHRQASEEAVHEDNSLAPRSVPYHCPVWVDCAIYMTCLGPETFCVVIEIPFLKNICIIYIFSLFLMLLT